MTIDKLTAAGFGHYEISNYARPGFESTHNFAYWRGKDYLGFGPSAFSTLGLQRWQNVPDSAAYMDRVLAGESATSFTEELTAETRTGEIAAFAVRTREGIATDALARWSKEIQEFHELGFLENRGDRTILTRRGKLMADSVAEAFV
jgi:oxygen-independent coproporphyrinogen-3 oxidase